MTTQVTVANVGPSMSVQGGISRVIGLIDAHLPPHIGFAKSSPTASSLATPVSIPRIGVADSVRDSSSLRAFSQLLILALGRRTVFHVHFAGRGSLLREGSLCVLLRLLRCQYAVHSHAAEVDLFHRWLPPICRRMLLWGLGGAGRVIVLTQFWHDYYASLLHLAPDRLLLLPNPANLPRSVPNRSGRDELRLLFLGRVGVRKGAFDVIQALAALPPALRSKCYLTLAGDGDLPRAQALVSDLGCSAHISLPGWVGADEVDLLLEQSDVLVLPSHAEGMAMALIEGMSWGLAVITTVAGGAGEFLKDGCNSLLVAAGDVPGISIAISELAQDPALRSRLGRAARETISVFGIETYIVRLSAVYEQLAEAL